MLNGGYNVVGLDLLTGSPVIEYDLQKIGSLGYI
jgi:hypothetical protein